MEVSQPNFRHCEINRNHEFDMFNRKWTVFKHVTCCMFTHKKREGMTLLHSGILRR